MSVLQLKDVENRIVSIRNQQVILDSDVAELYSVETKRINEAVKNNPEKFPEGYILELSERELKNLRSKFSTTNFSMTRVLPKAFTEKGLYMLATILKSPVATQTTLAIVEAFAKLRELSRTFNALAHTADKEQQETMLQNSSNIIAELIDPHFETTERNLDFELNLAIVKLRGSVKQQKKQEGKE